MMSDGFVVTSKNAETPGKRQGPGACGVRIASQFNGHTQAAKRIYGGSGKRKVSVPRRRRTSSSDRSRIASLRSSATAFKSARKS